MRKFNITGNIIPEEHYFVDLSPQIENLMALVADRSYFVINRPRQFGKTTMLNFLAQHLNVSEQYKAALISFQQFVQRPGISEMAFYSKIMKLISEELESESDKQKKLPDHTSSIKDQDDFFEWLREVCRSLPQKLVLLIDEIDAVPETVVAGFLAGLREMYLQRTRKPAPHAVGLVGVHDIRNLKAQYRDETRTLGSASPFNIAVDYELPPFSLENIRQYYSQHTEVTGQPFDDKVIARVHHVTNGHPWLVSVLAKSMVETIVTNRSQKILPEHTEEAIQLLINSRNPNFESLFHNADKPELFPIVLDLLIGRKYGFNILDDDINLGVKYGIFTEEHQLLNIANPIYAQTLYKHFEKELKNSAVKDIVEGNKFEEIYFS